MSSTLVWYPIPPIYKGGFDKVSMFLNNWKNDIFTYFDLH